MQVCFTPMSEVEIFASAVMNSGAERTSSVSSPAPGQIRVPTKRTELLSH